MVFDAPSANKKSLLYWAEVDDVADGDIVGEQLSDEVRRGSITWDKFDIPALALLDPGEEVFIDVMLPLKSFEQTDLTLFASHDITIFADAKYDVLGKTDNITASPVLLTVNSDMTIDIEDSISTDGTMHTVTWLLSNTFHELKDIVITADIFGDIEWDDSAMVVPAGTALFDSNTQRLTWTVDSMPTSIDILALQFPVVLATQNPTQTQLMSKVMIEAVDTVTGETIIIFGDEILL